MVYIGIIWYITVSNEFKKYHEVNHRWWIMTIWFHTVDFAWLCIVGDDTWVFGGLLWVQMDYWMYQMSPPTVPPMLHTFLWTNCMMIFTYIYIYYHIFIFVWLSNESKGITPLYPLGFIHFWDTFCQDFLGEQTPVADARRPVVHSGAMILQWYAMVMIIYDI